MAPRIQLRDSETGEAFMLEVNPAGRLKVLNGNASAKVDELPDGRFTMQLGSRYLLDPNEINGMGNWGAHDDTHSMDLGNSQATSLNRLAGGFCFPFDVNVLRVVTWWRANNNSAGDFGWVVYSQQKTAGSNTVSSSIIYNGVTEGDTINPNGTVNDFSDIDLTGVSAAQSIPALDIIGIGVDCPTTPTTNYYIEVMGGFMEFERAS